MLKVDELGIDEGEKVDGLCIGGAKKKGIPIIGRWKKNGLRREGCIVLGSRSRICIVEKLMGFALEATKKVIPGLWKENGEKGAMKEGLHCVESHEAKAALFFGRLQSGRLQFGRLQSGRLQGPGRMEKKMLSRGICIVLKAMKQNLHCFLGV